MYARISTTAIIAPNVNSNTPIRSILLSERGGPVGVFEFTGIVSPKPQSYNLGPTPARQARINGVAYWGTLDLPDSTRKRLTEVESLGTDIEVWNLLHDGCLVDVAGLVPGDVTVVVEIEYLRAMLPEPGNRFLIQLKGCQLFEFRRFVGDERLIGDQATVAAEEPEILSAKLQSGTAVISMTRGAGTYMQLHLKYDHVSVSTEDGRVVPVDELAAAQRYWEEFERNR